MKCCIVSSKILFEYDNWSPGFYLGDSSAECARKIEYYVHQIDQAKLAILKLGIIRSNNIIRQKILAIKGVVYGGWHKTSLPRTPKISTLMNGKKSLRKKRIK